MDDYQFFLEFIVVGFLFVTFFFIITIFGFFFFKLSKKSKLFDQSKKIPILTQAILSFGIGSTIFISFSYFLIIFNAFNFYSSYLPFLIFDIAYLIFWVFTNRLKLRIFFITSKIRNFIVNRSRLLNFFMIMSLYYFVFILYWEILTESIGLIKFDPYKWLSEVYFLLDNETLSFGYVGDKYPSGFALFTAGFLLPSSNYIISYFFMKFVPIFYILVFLLVGFAIFKKLFLKQWQVFIALILVIASYYFISRNLLNISSSLATLIVSISMLIIVYDFPDYLFGFFVSSLFLVNPLSLYLYILVLFPFLFLKYLLTGKGRKDLKKNLFSFLIFLSLAILLILPYLLAYSENILSIFNWYSNFISNPNFSLNFNTSPSFLTLIFPLDLFKEVTDNWLLIRYHNIGVESIFSFSIFSFIGLFLNIRVKERIFKNTLFFKICFIIVLLFNYLPYFFTNLNFMEFFKYRTLEVFILPVVVLAVTTINWLYIISIKLEKKIIDLYKSSFKKKRHNFNFINLEKLLILLLFLNLLPIFQFREPPEYNYAYNDDFVDLILVIRNEADSRSTIYYPYLENDFINFLLFDMEVYPYNLSEGLTYFQFLNNIKKSRIDYLIIYNDDFPIDWTNKIYVDVNFSRFIEREQYSLFIK